MSTKSLRAFTIYYDMQTGQLAKVEEHLLFRKENPLLRADVLRDATEELEARYAVSVRALHTYFQELQEKSKT